MVFVSPSSLDKDGQLKQRPATDEWVAPEILASKYPPAKPVALICEPLKAAVGSLTRPH
jgi:hypothetical protein